MRQFLPTEGHFYAVEVEYDLGDRHVHTLYGPYVSKGTAKARIPDLERYGRGRHIDNYTTRIVKSAVVWEAAE